MNRKLLYVQHINEILYIDFYILFVIIIVIVVILEFFHIAGIEYSFFTCFRCRLRAMEMISRTFS